MGAVTAAGAVGSGLSAAACQGEAGGAAPSFFLSFSRLAKEMLGNG